MIEALYIAYLNGLGLRFYGVEGDGLNGEQEESRDRAHLHPSSSLAATTSV